MNHYSNIAKKVTTTRLLKERVDLTSNLLPGEFKPGYPLYFFNSNIPLFPYNDEIVKCIVDIPKHFPILILRADFKSSVILQDLSNRSDLA